MRIPLLIHLLQPPSFNIAGNSFSFEIPTAQSRIRETQSDFHLMSQRNRLAPVIDISLRSSSGFLGDFQGRKRSHFLKRPSATVNAYLNSAISPPLSASMPFAARLCRWKIFPCSLTWYVAMRVALANRMLTKY